MKVYTCTTFTGFYPVGASAVVVAKDRASAARALTKELKEKGIASRGGPDAEVPDTVQAKDMELVSTNKPCVSILQDGEY